MVQRGQHLGLALEPGEAVGIRRERFRQDLDRDGALQVVSVARYTSPMPPAPSGAVISYGPSRAPLARP